MGAQALGFHSVAPRCVRTKRWGRCVNDSWRPGIVQWKGMAGIVRHSQTKGRATGNAKPGLKPPDGRHTEREEELIAKLHEQLRDRTYRPRAVKRVAIPKAGGGTRYLGIPSVADRVVQQALVQKMTPIFEPLFADCSFGYCPGRSPHMAMRKVWREINEGNLWILDADLRSYFDKIDQERLVDLIAAEISDGRVLQLIRSFLEAGVIIDGAWEPTKTGVPQGGVASPLWSNIYLTPFDHAMTNAGYRPYRGKPASLSLLPA